MPINHVKVSVEVSKAIGPWKEKVVADAELAVALRAAAGVEGNEEK